MYQSFFVVFLYVVLRDSFREHQAEKTMIKNKNNNDTSPHKGQFDTGQEGGELSPTPDNVTAIPAPLAQPNGSTDPAPATIA